MSDPLDRDQRPSTLQLLVNQWDRFRGYALQLMRRRPAAGRSEEPEDYVQQAIEDYLKNRPAKKSDTHVLNLFRSMIKRAFTDKEKARRAAKRGYGAQPQELPSSVAVPADPQAGPVTVLSRKERDALVAAAMVRLSPEDQEVLTARNWEGLAWQEIARRLDLPSEDAARMRYKRALQRLKEEIAGLPGGGDLGATGTSSEA